MKNLKWRLVLRLAALCARYMDSWDNQPDGERCENCRDYGVWAGCDNCVRQGSGEKKDNFRRKL